MDALEFVKERIRMCMSHVRCGGCPLAEAKCSLTSSSSDEECKQIIAAVEQWSKEHPRKTRQSMFLEQWPNAARDAEGVLNICPKLLDVDISCTDDETERTGLCKACDDCQREFWMQEVE